MVDGRIDQNDPEPAFKGSFFRIKLLQVVKHLQKGLIQYPNGFLLISCIAETDAHSIGIEHFVQCMLAAALLLPAPLDDALQNVSGGFVH